jgi:hypothetical protein
MTLRAMLAIRLTLALREHQREALLDEIAHLAESLPETLDLPTESEVDLCRRV